MRLTKASNSPPGSTHATASAAAANATRQRQEPSPSMLAKEMHGPGQPCEKSERLWLE
jgi:hypothetical protein